MKTVKYKFGQTPERVIRERIGGRSELKVTINKDAGDGRHRQKGIATQRLSADDLIEMLDGLWLSALEVVKANQINNTSGTRNEVETKPGQLRVEMLAGLKIKES